MVASLRGVIAKQAAEIEALQSKLKELTTTSLATADPATTPEAPQPTAKFAEVRDVFLFSPSSLLPILVSRWMGDMNLIMN